MINLVWWESVDYGLTDVEKRQVASLSRRLVYYMRMINLKLVMLEALMALRGVGVPKEAVLRISKKLHGKLKL